MTTQPDRTRTQNRSEHPTPKLPPVDEVCRILARVLNRVQGGLPPTAPTGDAS